MKRLLNDYNYTLSTTEKGKSLMVTINIPEISYNKTFEVFMITGPVGPDVQPTEIPAKP